MRRHGPEGYPEHRDYRNWLRDEFMFRCVYCLRRETWLTTRRDYEIDHFLPKSDHPDAERDYDNLVLACRECNGTKAAKYLPSPESVGYGQCLYVDEDGHIHPRNELGITIIEVLRLDGQEHTKLRRRILTAISENKPGSGTMKWCLGYPDADDLPNLSAEKDPKRNNRPNGIHDSHFERMRRGELPAFY